MTVAVARVCVVSRGGGAMLAVLLLALALARTARAALLPLDAERLRASVGGYAVMNCHLDFPFGNEIPYHLQWDKDGETIFSWYSGSGEPLVADRWGGRVRRVSGGGAALGRGSVNVSAVRETDAGLYRCRVAFPNRTPPERNNGTFYYLDVEGGNLIVTPPTNVTVMEGEPAELECLPKSPEWAVQWYREGAPVEALPELAARSERARNGSLLLRHAASGDLGEYECRVSAPDEPGEPGETGARTQSATAFLDVQYKAKVVYSPKERYLPYGKSASLDCYFSANPPLTNLRWEKDGFLFDPYNVPGVFYSRNGSLLFNRVDETHEGVYSCTPYNALGSAGASGGVRVRVQLPPALAARPLPLYLARLGAAVTLPCAAAAQPHAVPPAIRWTRKDGSALPEGRYALSEGNLTISGVRAEDRGVYVCAVSNEAAALAVETELLVESVPPRAPHSLSAAPAARSVHLSWVPGHNGADVEYTVWYREKSDSEWRTMKILSRGVTDATLLRLRAAADYELRVLAQDRLGDGLFSKPIFVRTLDPDLGEDDDATAYEAVATEETTNTGAAAAETSAASGTSSTSGTSATSGTSGPSGPGWTSGPSGASEASGMSGMSGPSAAAPDELAVSVRLIEEGALVRWERAPGDDARCTLRWYDAAEPAPRLLAALTTYQDYLLVSEVEEGGSYAARVQCGRGAGGAALRVPQYARLRGVAAGSAAAALLLAALAAALCVARRRLRRHDKRPR